MVYPVLDMIAFAIIAFFLVMGIDLWTDYNLWQDGKPINHLRGAILRAIALVPSFLILAGFWPTIKEMGIPRKWLALSLTTLLMMGSVWWLVFDSTLNLLRGFPLLFNGSRDADDSVLDRFLMGMEDWQEGLLKVGLVIGSISLYLITKKKWLTNDNLPTHS